MPEGCLAAITTLRHTAYCLTTAATGINGLGQWLNCRELACRPNPRTRVWVFVPHIRKEPDVVISICPLGAEKGRYSRSQGSVTSQPYLLGELEARKRHCFTKQSRQHLRNDTRDCPLASDCTHTNEWTFPREDMRSALSGSQVFSH